MAPLTAESSVGTITAPIAGAGAAFEGELLKCPVAWLPDLPVATGFVLEAPGIPVEIRCITTRLAEQDGEDGRRSAAFLDGEELRAVALAVQAERLTSADFRGFCLLKLQDPGFRITEEIALAGAQASEQERSRPWALGRILAALGVELRAAELLAAAPSVHPSKPPRRAVYGTAADERAA